MFHGHSRRVGASVGAGHRSLVVGRRGAGLEPRWGTVWAQDPVTFRIGITQSPSETGLNPYLAVLAADYTLFTDQYDLLVEFGPDLKSAPGLAESWDISEDGLTWTWHIRPGVTWSDGTPFTAEDARFQIQYIIDSHDPAYTGPALDGTTSVMATAPMATAPRTTRSRCTTRISTSTAASRRCASRA